MDAVPVTIIAVLLGINLLMQGILFYAFETNGEASGWVYYAMIGSLLAYVGVFVFVDVTRPKNQAILGSELQTL